MYNNLPNDWWRRRRIWLPTLALVMLAGSLTITWIRSDLSRIVVYNETMRPLSGLRITACGQSQNFEEVAEGESVRFTLEKRGAPSDVKLATNGIEFWHGDYVESHGYRTFVHLLRTGDVESSSGISWIRRPFFIPSDAE